MKETVPLVPAKSTETASGVAKLLLAALLMVVAMLMMAPDDAGAQEAVDPSVADSDGYVPIYSVCLPENEFTGEEGGLYDVAALYIPYDDGFSIQGYILLNECALERYGAGPNDRQRVIDHELGHAAGLLDSADPSNIMYPFYNATGS